MLDVQDAVRDAIQKNGNAQENLLPVLQDVSRTQGYLSEDAMTLVAKAMGISPADVYGVATFYSFIDTVPRGKHVIRVCKTISCYIHGRDSIVEAIEKKLRIQIGETTPDGRYTFVSTNCIGQCHEGPAMLVNDEVFTNLSPEEAVRIIERYV